MIKPIERGDVSLERVKVRHLFGFCFEVQEYGLAMLDGCPDYCWKTLQIFYDEEEANAFASRLEADWNTRYATSQK